MGVVLKNIFRFALLILVQVYVLDNIRLHYMVTPYLYMLFVLWLPFQMGRAWQMIIAFLLGFTLDSFRHCPGFHASACVLIAYIRPYLINLLIPQEGAETNYDEPSVKSMGGVVPYALYLAVLIFIHHAWLFLIETLQFGGGMYFIVKTVLSTILSLLLIAITELFFSRKQKFRTNTI